MSLMKWTAPLLLALLLKVDVMDGLSLLPTLLASCQGLQVQPISALHEALHTETQQTFSWQKDSFDTSEVRALQHSFMVVSKRSV